MRRDSPPSDSELTTEAKPFSISSIISTQGAMRSAVARARSRFFSDSPMNLSKSRPGSSRRSGNPQSLATALAARLLPQPWTPRRRMPRGAGTPNSLASGVKARLRLSSQALRPARPPTSPRLSGTGTQSSTRSFERSSCFISAITSRSRGSRVRSSSTARVTARSASNRVSPRSAAATLSRISALGGGPSLCWRARLTKTSSVSLRSSDWVGSSSLTRLARPASSGGRSMRGAVMTRARRSRAKAWARSWIVRTTAASLSER